MVNQQLLESPEAVLPGIVILVLTYFSVYFSRDVRSDYRVLWTLMLILTAYHIGLLVNLYVRPIKGASGDALVFHENAKLWAQSGS
jgi:hypothetical protein